ncbi:RmlC-like cupin domain-containing protein [Durotheca rogersii]|uniref:RmlC-like cupin domain-containing protein n=1 Tax=Durotheca rogersii TaxID=419775 RepID=UPI00221E440C|nr:RmlC-like cupin domain-containing protein [Durotheca rogersii]KAI5865055.1 RmlC-like cupin domain-containing protein [Durotheca rogersii]
MFAKASTVAAILAFCSVASAAPAPWSSVGPHTETASATKAAATAAPVSSTTATATTATTAPAKTPAAATPPSGLSKVQQILLADTRADALNNVLADDADFVFDFNQARKFGPGKGGEIVLANRKAFPALTGTGISAAVGFLGPCGFNTPHVHNRATELLIVVRGEVVSEMVVENGVVAAAAGDAPARPRNVLNTVRELQATPYYPGALHSQYNPTCEDAVFVAPLSSEDPGANTIAQAYLALRDDTVRAAAGNHIDGADIERFRGAISPSVALGVEQCLQKCGIAKR